MKLNDIIQIDYALAQASIQENREGNMKNIKTLDERFEEHHNATITVAEQLEMSRAEVAELKQALADSNLALMEQTEIAQAANRQAEEARVQAPVAAITEQKCKVRMNMISGNVRGVFLESYPYDIEQKTERLVDAIAYGAAPQQHAQAALSNAVKALPHFYREGIENGGYVLTTDVLRILATRQPAPVAADVVQGEALSQDAGEIKTTDEAEALYDLRKAITNGASDEWLLGFIRQYPFAQRAASQPDSERDAARYRELRDHGLFVVSASGVGWAIRRDEDQSTSDEMDTAMDEHMRVKSMAEQLGQKP